MRPLRIRPLLAALLLAAGLGACADDDPLGPEDVDSEDVVGTYDATTFTVTEGGISVGLLALGADVEVTLTEDGTTSGRLLVPDADEDGGDLDADLAGTYTFDDETRQVAFQQSADTFLRDLTMLAIRTSAGIELRGAATFGGSTVELVLRRRGG